MTSFFRNLFLHFYDVHFLELKGVTPESSSIRRQIEFECTMATRFAILAGARVYVPAASFFESPLCARIIGKLQGLYHLDTVYLVGGGLNAAEFITDKLKQYKRSSHQYQSYQAATSQGTLHPPFYSRTRSASKDIVSGWNSFLKDGQLGRLVEGSNMKLPKQFDKKWESLPESLGGRAFIYEYVAPRLLKGDVAGTVRNRIKSVINRHYFDSFTREVYAGVITNLVYLAAPHSIPSYDANLPYREVLHAARKRNLISRIENATPLDLMSLRADPEWLTCLMEGINDDTSRRQYSSPEETVVMIEELRRSDIGIITALPLEFAAACEVFQAQGPVRLPGFGGGRMYALARTRGRDGSELIVAIAQLTEMGTNSAAIRATKLIEHCPRAQIIMTGIAGAVPDPAKPEHHVRLGDIVVSNRNGVIQYDLDKETPLETEIRNPPRPPGPRLLEAVQWLRAEEERGKRVWEEHLDRALFALQEAWFRPEESSDRLQDGIDDLHQSEHPLDPNRRLGRPRVFHGPIASANKLLKNPKKRNSLRDRFRVKAVEMEGSGVADATWNEEKGYLVVRGTCDYCNSDKGDAWQRYAAVSAAAYTRAVVELFSHNDQ